MNSWRRQVYAATVVAACVTAIGATAGSREAAHAAESAAAEVSPALMSPASGGERVASPRDLKDGPIAVDPETVRRLLAIVSNPTNPQVLVILVQRGTSNYVAYRSTDAGRSWSGPVPLPQQSGSFCCSASGDLAYAQDGKRLYAAYTQFQPDIGLDSIVVSASDDDGTTWAPPVVALAAADHTEYARPRIATGAADADRNWIYLTGGSDRDEGPVIGIAFTRSGDGGATWGAPQNLVSGNVETYPVSGGAVASGRSGRVLVSWYNPNFCNGQQAIEVAASQDHGATFAAPVMAAADPSDPDCLGGGKIDLKIEGKGLAHLVYQRVPPQPGGDEADIGYVSSPFPYTAWSQPLTVNDDALPHTQILGSLTTERCGASTVLHLVWQDPRLSAPASPDSRWNVFYARKLARAGAPWSKNLRVSDRSSSFESAFPRMTPGVAASRGRAFAAWIDGRDRAFGSGILSGVTCP